MDEVDVVLVAVHGERKAALGAVRKLVDWPLTEVVARMRSLPLVIASQLSPSDAVELVGRAASDVVRLEIQLPDGRPWSDPTGRLHVTRRPHVAERVDARRGEGRIRFAVDDVAPAAAPPKTMPERARWAALIEGELLHVPAERALVEAPAHVSPLLSAVQIAFDHHHPLRLTPDAVWLTIAAGFAQHVDRNAETLRARFVRHEGRKTVPVRWEGSFERMVEALADHVEEGVGPGLRRLMTCDFSTSTPLDRCVSDVMLLSTFRRFFDYLVVGICGIPEIELAGTPEDPDHGGARVRRSRGRTPRGILPGDRSVRAPLVSPDGLVGRAAQSRRRPAPRRAGGGKGHRRLLAPRVGRGRLAIRR